MLWTAPLLIAREVEPAERADATRMFRNRPINLSRSRVRLEAVCVRLLRTHLPLKCGHHIFMIENAVDGFQSLFGRPIARVEISRKRRLGGSQRQHHRLIVREFRLVLDEGAP